MAAKRRAVKAKGKGKGTKTRERERTVTNTTGRPTVAEMRADALAMVAHAALTLGIQPDDNARALSVILAALHGAADGPAGGLRKPLEWARGRRKRGEGGWLSTSTPATRAEAVRSLLDSVERVTRGEAWTCEDLAFAVSTVLHQHAVALGASIPTDSRGVRLDEVVSAVARELDCWGLGWDESKRTDHERIARHCLMAVGLSEKGARNIVNGALKSRP